MDDKRPINEERAEAGEADASFKSSILINLGNSSDSPDHREKAVAFTYNTRSRTLLQDNTISHKQSVAKGDTSTVKVAQTSVKEAALAWNKGGNSVPNINDTQQRSHVGNSSHVGNGDTVSQATQNPQVPSNLNISGPTRNPPSAPRFTRPLRDLSLREGEKVILETVVTVRLPRHADLLQCPYSEEVHPMGKSLGLTACIVSGLHSLVLEFQERLQKSSLIHGDCPPIDSINMHGGNMFFGVINGKLIPFNRLKRF